MSLQEIAPDSRFADLQRSLRTAAHDLNNLHYRLTLLSERLEGEIPGVEAREAAKDLLKDTSARLAEIVRSLRGLAAGQP